MVAYISEGSFLVLDWFMSQKGVSSLDVDLATLSLLGLLSQLVGFNAARVAPTFHLGLSNQGRTTASRATARVVPTFHLGSFDRYFFVSLGYYGYKDGFVRVPRYG